MSGYTVHHNVHDPVTRCVMQQVVGRLPVPVIEWVCANVHFVSVPTGGRVIGPGGLPRERWVVMLHEGTMATTEALGVVGHEIAHCVLGHTTGGAAPERAAASLVASWGFRGLGADPEHAAALHANELVVEEEVEIDGK